jgi:hypothetical protein
VEQSPEVSSGERNDALDARSAMQTVLWWAAGTAITVVPIVASIIR